MKGKKNKMQSKDYGLFKIEKLSNSKCQIKLSDDPHLFIVTKMVNENNKWGIYPDNSDHFIEAEFVLKFRNLHNYWTKIVYVKNFEDIEYINKYLIDGCDDIFNKITFYQPNIWFGYSNMCF